MTNLMLAIPPIHKFSSRDGKISFQFCFLSKASVSSPRRFPVVFLYIGAGAGFTLCPITALYSCVFGELTFLFDLLTNITLLHTLKGSMLRYFCQLHYALSGILFEFGLLRCLKFIIPSPPVINRYKKEAQTII